MEIILSPQCENLTGFLDKNYGYAVQKRKSKFYGVRSTRGLVPPNGHIRFIFACAKLAQAKLYATDIRLHWSELYDALYEAHHWIAADQVRWNGREAKKRTYNARDILNLKTTFGL